MKTNTNCLTRSHNLLLAGALLVMCPAAAAQTVSEVSDAGTTLAGAQDETTNAITLITGSLGTVTDVDIYKITIDDPANFSATTAGPTGAGTAEDTRLFLMDGAGLAIYANDDLPDGSTLRSILPAGHTLSPTTAGDYYLAVTSYPMYPTDGTTNTFNEPDEDPAYDYTDILGANTATTNPMSAWTGSGGDSGTYEISLTGVNGTLPVELASFEVRVDRDAAVINWETASESDNSGFEVEIRAAGREDFSTMTFVPATGSASVYSIQSGPLLPGRYEFRLRQVDLNGSATYSHIVEAAVSLTQPFALAAAYPNPFAVNSTMALSVQERQFVRAEIFDLAGRRIQTLFARTMPAQTTEMLTIDGTNLANGAYVVRIRGERFVSSELVTVSR